MAKRASLSSQQSSQMSLMKWKSRKMKFSALWCAFSNTALTNRWSKEQIKPNMVWAQALSQRMSMNCNGLLIDSKVGLFMEIVIMFYRKICHLEGTRIQELEDNWERKVSTTTWKWRLWLSRKSVMSVKVNRTINQKTKNKINVEITANDFP